MKGTCQISDWCATYNIFVVILVLQAKHFVVFFVHCCLRTGKSMVVKRGGSVSITIKALLVNICYLGFSSLSLHHELWTGGWFQWPGLDEERFWRFVVLVAGSGGKRRWMHTMPRLGAHCSWPYTPLRLGPRSQTPRLFLSRSERVENGHHFLPLSSFPRMAFW